MLSGFSSFNFSRIVATFAQEPRDTKNLHSSNVASESRTVCSSDAASFLSVTLAHADRFTNACRGEPRASRTIKSTIPSVVLNRSRVMIFSTNRRISSFDTSFKMTADVRVLIVGGTLAGLVVQKNQ